MTARPWGTTGRVTLGPEWEHGADIAQDVVVDGEVIGRALAPRAWGEAFSGWGAISHHPFHYRDNLPSLDAAVRWVLRRADADVWRQERGPVVRIGRISRRLWWGYRKDGLVVASGSTWPRAMAAVRTYLSEATP